MKKNLSILILMLVVAPFGFSQTWIETDKVVASDRAADDYFGFSNVINNNQLIIGAYHNRPSGAVYIYDKVGADWTESYRLQRANTDQYDEFGRGIIVDDNTIVVSDYSTNNSSLYDIGSVYIYKKNASGIWTEEAELYANAPRQYGNFGLETGLDNNTLVVGSDLGNVNVIAFNATTSTWDFTQELTTTDGLTSAAAVDIEANHIVVGTFDFDETELANSGAAYIFEKDINTGVWMEIQKILSPDLAAGQRFGKKVFFHNDFLLIASVSTQKVYIYKYNTVTNQYDYTQRLSGESGFGQSIAAENNTMVIGAYSASYDASNGNYTPSAGAIYTYELGGSNLWGYTQKVIHSDRDNINWLGSSVSIDNEVILAGAPYQDKDENNMNHAEKAGAAYIFQLDSNLSSEEFSIEKFSFYPNPTYGIINIQNTQNIHKIEIFDITGKLLKTFKTGFESLSISEFQVGVYVMRVSNDKGVINSKIIKKADL